MMTDTMIAPARTKIPSAPRSSDVDLCRTVIMESESAQAAKRKDLDRCLKSWRAYFAADGGQWDEKDKEILKDAGRQIAQYNVISPKVDALAGALLADLPDLNWTPVEGEKSMVTEAVAENYYSDKELFNYDDSFLKVFRDGLIHSGDAYLYMDSQYGHKRICVARELPGFIIWDPRWQTDNDRDAEVVFRYRYLTPARIVQHYEHKAEEVLRVLRDQRRRPAEYPADSARRKQAFEGLVGDEYQVIEKHYLKYIKGTRLLGRREGSEQWIPFPVGKDREYLMMFAEMNSIDWMTVCESQYEDRVHHFTAVCKELAVLLAAEEKSEVQVNGLPFYHFATKRMNGEDMGIVEEIMDVQNTINKRESLNTELISKSNGGSSFVNQNLFKDEQQRQEWIKNKNKPGHAEFVDLDSTNKTIEHIAANQYPAAVLDQINRMYDKVLPLVSRASDALSSITSSGDSGVLFERKFQLNLIANTLMNRSIRQFVNNVGEGYFYQWQVAYRDLERKVSFREGGRSITLNQQVGDGRVYNSVADTPRCRVIVTENTKSQTYQMRWRGIYGEMMRNIDPQASPAHYFMVLKNFIETLQLSENDKVVMKEFNELMIIKGKLMMLKDITALQAGLQGDTLQSIQMKMQLDQLMQQAAQQAAQMQGQSMGMGMEVQQAAPEGAYPIQLPQEGQMALPGPGQGGGGEYYGANNQQPAAAQIADLIQDGSGQQMQTQPQVA